MYLIKSTFSNFETGTISRFMHFMKGSNTGKTNLEKERTTYELINSTSMLDNWMCIFSFYLLKITSIVFNSKHMCYLMMILADPMPL